MATEVISKVCRNIGQLKDFIGQEANKIPIRGTFGEPVRFTVWKKDSDESGPRMYLGMDADSERDDYYRRIFSNAVGRLARLGHQRKMSRQELSAQIVLLLESYDEKKETFTANC
jgi:hypothetical protein